MNNKTVKRILCFLGMHNWYYGNYCEPVWGRYERHCMEDNCDEKQFYDSKTKKWIKFKYEPSEK